MPRLKIVGCADFIEIDKEKAKTIEEFLYDPDTKSDTMIRVGELSVLKRDIRAIIPDNAVDYERENRYNLSDEKDKAVIKDFEKEFLRFVAEEKEKGKSEDFKRFLIS